jgi:hypothetical protein
VCPRLIVITGELAEFAQNIRTLPEERAAICEFALQPEDRLSQSHLDDGRRGRGLRRREHGLPGLERANNSAQSNVFEIEPGAR